MILNIQRQPGANIIDGRRSGQGAAAAAASRRCRPSVKVAVLTDRTTTIRASVKDVEFELMLTIALVVMVIFLFLRNLSATIIPSVAVPLSLVGTFGVMYLLGYSLNNLTLMALTISTGFVVDDAIVMIENITRYHRGGRGAARGRAEGRRADRLHDLSLTVSLIAVLIPLLFMGDIVGRLFREFAVTLAVTILVSAVVSLTLTPMMCAKLLRHKPEPSKDGSTATRSGCSTRSSVLRQDAAVGAAPSDIDAAGRGGDAGPDDLLYIIVPKGFFPVQDTGVIQGVSEAPQSVSFPAMASGSRRWPQVILQGPRRSRVCRRSSASTGPTPPSTADAF